MVWAHYDAKFLRLADDMDSNTQDRLERMVRAAVAETESKYDKLLKGRNRGREPSILAEKISGRWYLNLNNS